MAAVKLGIAADSTPITCTSGRRLFTARLTPAINPPPAPILNKPIRIEPGQKVSVVIKNGGFFTGSFIGMTETSVKVQTIAEANAKPSEWDIRQVQAFQTRDGIFAFNESAGQFEPGVTFFRFNKSNQAMERIINLFPQNLYKQLYMDLSLNIRAVISQRLVMGLDGRRVAAMEIMINTPHIADLILKGNIGEIKAAMEQSGAKGMQSFDMALHDLYREDHISLEEALSNADSRTNLEAKINFG